MKLGLTRNNILLFLLVAAAFVFAACGGGESGGTPAPTPQGAEEPAAQYTPNAVANRAK